MRADHPIQVRPSHTARDMVISLLVLLLPVAVIVGLFRLRGGEDVTLVDPAPAIAQARSAALFPVAEPSGLPEGWRCVSAVFRREQATGALRVGYLTPAGGAVQLVESNEAPDQLLARELGDRPRSAGSVTVAGHPWLSYQVRNGELALVRTDIGRTLVVVGHAEPTELERLATALTEPGGEWASTPLAARPATGWAFVRRAYARAGPNTQAGQSIPEELL